MKDSSVYTSALFRNGLWVAVLLSVAMAVHAVYGQNGFLAWRQQRKEVQSLQNKIHRLQQENDELDHEDHALKTNPSAIERLAREQMRLAKPGEKIYPIPNKLPTISPAAPSANTNSPATSSAPAAPAP